MLMSDPEDKQKHSRKRLRNFLAKKLREGQFRKKVHEDEKSKQKERKWRYVEQEEDNDFDS